MINRRLMIVLPALSSGGHTEQLETASKGSSRLLRIHSEQYTRPRQIWWVKGASKARLQEVCNIIYQIEFRALSINFRFCFSSIN